MKRLCKKIYFATGILILTAPAISAAGFSSPTEPEQPSLIDALYSATLLEEIVVGSILLLAAFGSLTLFRRLRGVKEQTDAYRSHKARYAEKELHLDQLGAELEEQMEVLSGLRGDVADLVRQFIQFPTDSDYKELSDDRKIVALVQMAIEKIEEIEASADQRVQEERGDHSRYTDRISEMSAEIHELEKSKGELQGKLMTAQRAGYRELSSTDDNAGRFAAVELLFADITQSDQEVSRKHISSLVETILQSFPDFETEIKPFAYVTEEQKRIAQYEAIISLYNEKISSLREKTMDEEDREEAIIAMKRLRDREIDTLEQA